MTTAQSHTAGETATRFRRFWRIARTILLGLAFVSAVAAILLIPTISGSTPYDLEVSDVAPEDIRAPEAISYVSEIETEAAREAAAQAVQNVFDPPDPRVGRQQVLKARQIMDFVATVRNDSHADSRLKRRYITNITPIELPPNLIETLLSMPDSQFEIVEREVVFLIEDSMSGQVREGQVEDVISRLELKVGSDVPEDLIPITVTIARQLVEPNSALNVAATDERRAQARSDVPVIRHNYQRNEIVIRAGERVDELDLEALQKLGLTAQGILWEDVASVILLSILASAVMGVYIGVFDSVKWQEDLGRLSLILILFTFFLLVAQFMVTGSEGSAYLFPAAGLALALTALVDVQLAVVTSIVMAILVGYLAGGSLNIATLTAASSLLAAGTLRRATRLNAYFLAGLAAAVGAIAGLLVFQLPAQPDPARMAQLLLLALINGLLSAGVALVILFVVGNLTGMATSLRLLDLLRPDHPLQRRLQQEALGTYQHTLSVANLVEAAAEAIEADTLLARVGTLYHDVGKTNNPGFFAENRTEGGTDPHKGLSPLASARIIKAHVADGLDLAKRHRLPTRIVEFISEHHGTMPIIYFLHQAREDAEQSGATVTESHYIYDGPPPQSTETAILMLADSCESATRANKPDTEEGIRKLVDRIVQQRIDYGQLEQSHLTLTQIQQIKDSFVRTLKGMYHPRVQYPDDKKEAKPEAKPTSPVQASSPPPREDATIVALDEDEQTEQDEVKSARHDAE